MSNPFIRATAAAIDRHGSMISYTSVQEGTYDVNTGSVVSTNTSYSIKSYMKHIRATQFNYPNLIGKEAGLFYILAYGLAFIPDVQDTILFNSKTYKVDSVQSHLANSQIVLYRIMGVV
jgi:hypothetical protein